MPNVYDNWRTNQPIPEYADILSLREWNAYLDNRTIIRSDGTGYWATETYMDTTTSAFDNKPDWATHVAWFNK